MALLLNVSAAKIILVLESVVSLPAPRRQQNGGILRILYWEGFRVPHSIDASTHGMASEDHIWQSGHPFHPIPTISRLPAGRSHGSIILSIRGHGLRNDAVSRFVRPMVDRSPTIVGSLRPSPAASPLGARWNILKIPFIHLSRFRWFLATPLL